MPVTKLKIRSTKDHFIELVNAFPLRPIRTASSHQQAKRVLRGLAAERGAAAVDYKTVLVSLIATYEADAGFRVDTSKLSAADIVRHLLTERGLSVNALAKKAGVAQSALSDMLNGKRDWSKNAMVRIADFFGLQPGLFLR